jgi:hypothetical protein
MLLFSRRNRLLTPLIRIAICVFAIVQCTTHAFAAPRTADSRVVTRQQADKGNAAKARSASKPPKRISPDTRKNNPVRRQERSSDVFYHWSPEQLMMGGVDPGVGMKGAKKWSAELAADNKADRQ